MKIINSKLVKIKVTKGHVFLKEKIFHLVKKDKWRYVCILSGMQFFDIFNELEVIKGRKRLKSYVTCNSRTGALKVDEIQFKGIELMTLRKMKVSGLRLRDTWEIEELDNINISNSIS